MERNKSRMARITIEVAGYRWRVHGSKTGGMWHTHLVELLGGERLDAPSEEIRASGSVAGRVESIEEAERLLEE